MTYDDPQTGLPALNVHSFPQLQAADIRADMSALRMSVTVAWRAKGVMLTSTEEAQIRDELAELGAYLKSLTQPRTAADACGVIRP